MIHAPRPARLTTKRRFGVAVAAGAVALSGILGACGSSSKTTSATTSAATTAASGSSQPAGSSTVIIKNFAFKPMSLTVKVGSTVTFTNEDSTDHNIQFSDKSIALSPNLSVDGPTKSWSHTFTKAGSYPYICGIHNYMTGTITVTS